MFNRAEEIGNRIILINDTLYIEYKARIKEGADDVLFVNKSDFALIYHIYPLLCHSEYMHDDEWFNMQYACLEPNVIEDENGNITVYAISYHLCHKENNYVIRYYMKQHEYLTGLTIQNYESKTHEYIHSVITRMIKTKNNKSDAGNIYVLEREDGLCKIGRSISPKKRLKQIETQGGLEVKNQYISHRIINYKKIEHMIHDMIKEQKYKGEWFNICFDDAVDTVNHLVDSYGKKVKNDDNFCQSVIEHYKNNQSANALFYMFRSE